MFLVLTSNHGDVVRVIQCNITQDELEDLQAETRDTYNQSLHETSVAIARDAAAVRRIIGRCNGE
jgi:hypothetical protein